MNAFFIVGAVAYLLGSIPFGYILVKLSGGGDIRQTGSGNIGATNVARKNPTLGVLTLLLDAAKGFLAVAFALRWATESPESGRFELAALAALMAILGHVFTFWLKFKGGKGVATGVGAFLALAPKAVLLVLAIFALLVLAFRYVSLGSIVATALFPIAAYVLHPEVRPQAVTAMTCAGAFLIVAKHHENIRRLFAGTENKLGAKRA